MHIGLLLLLLFLLASLGGPPRTAPGRPPAELAANAPGPPALPPAEPAASGGPDPGERSVLDALSHWGDQFPPLDDAVAAVRRQGAKAVPVLEKELPASDAGRRAAIAEMLRYAGAEALSLLMTLARDPDGSVRYHAAESIGYLGPAAAAALPVLLDLLRDGEVAEGATDSILLIGHLDTVDAETLVALIADEEAHSFAGLVVTSMGDGAGAALLAAFRPGNEDARREVAMMLAILEHPPEGAFSPALAGLEDADERVRQWSAAILARFGPAAAGAADRLARLLRDPSEDVRSEAVQAISTVLPRGLLDVAGHESILADPSSFVRMVAVSRLAEAGAPPAAYEEPIAALLRDEDPAVVLATAKWILGSGSPDPAVIAALIGLLANQPIRVADEAIALLGGIEVPDPRIDDALTESARSPYDRIRSASLEALVRRASELSAKLAFARAGLEDPEPPVRRTAAGILGALGEPALPDLLHAMADGDGTVRKAAFEAAQTGSEALLRRLAWALEGEAGWFRVAAARSFVRLGGDRAVAAAGIRAALKEKGPRGSSAADLATVLGEVGARAPDAALLAGLIADVRADVISFRYSGFLARAAVAHRRLSGSNGLAVAVLAGLFDDPLVVEDDRLAALGAVGELGLDAVELVPRLRTLTRSLDVPTRAAASEALRAVAGD